MSQKFVAVETFTAARRKQSDAGGDRFCSRVTDRASGRATVKDIDQAPEGIPMANVFVRPIDSTKPHEVLLFEGEKARRLGCAFETQDLSVQKSLSRLQLPKPQVGAATLEMAVGTMYGLDQEVLDLSIALHASNLFASMEYDPRDMQRAQGKYICATEFQTPTRRAKSEASQEPPLLEMKIWNLKSVAGRVREKIIEPVGRAMETVKLRQEVAKLQADIKTFSIQGDLQKQEAAEAQVAQKSEKLSTLERDPAQRNILVKLILGLADRGISVGVFKDSDLRRTTPKPEEQIIIGDPKGVEGKDQVFNAQLFRLQFADWKRFDVYLNEYVVGSNGKPRMKDTVLHHIEQLRTDELDRVAALFCRLEYPDMLESDRNKVATEIQQYARIAAAERARYGRPLSEEAARVFAVIERYVQVNTIMPRTAFRTNDDWVREFSNPHSSRK
jgi:hypothetical protein